MRYPDYGTRNPAHGDLAFFPRFMYRYPKSKLISSLPYRKLTMAHRHRPTPHSIAVAALIALHCQPDSPLYSSSSCSDTTDDDCSEYRWGIGKKNDNNSDKQKSKDDFDRVDSFLRTLFLCSSAAGGTNAATGTTGLATASGSASASGATSDPEWFSWHGPRVHLLFQQLDSAFALLQGERNKNANNDNDNDNINSRNQSNNNLTVPDQFRGWLRIAVSSIDALTDLMTTIQRSVSVDECIDTDSVQGIFLRSLSLGYDELPFESVIELWKDFREQVFDEDGSCVQRWTRSSEQMEHSIREQCWRTALAGRIQAVRTDDDDNDDSNLDHDSTQTMLANLDEVLQQNPELPSAHFLRFVCCLKSGERVGAVDALHQYVDYALSSKTESGGEDILPFSAILLAALHDQFGEEQLGAAATEEAVCIAQQSQDAGAVAFALGWLAIHARNKTANANTSNRSNNLHSSQELLQRCAQHADGIRSLVAGANLSLAAETQSWAGHDQALADGAIVNNSDLRNTASADRPTHGAHLDEECLTTKVTTGVSAALAPKKLVAAGIWNHWGETTLSIQSTASALHCHGDRMSSSDVAVSIQNLCCAAMSGSATLVFHVCQHHLGIESIFPVNTSNSIYGNAIRLYVALRDKYCLPVNGVFLFDLAILLHEWAVRRCDLVHAEALMAAIESYLHSRIDNYDQILFDVKAQKALLLSRQKQYDKAKLVLEVAIVEYKAVEQHELSARLLLQLSGTLLESNPGQFASVLRPILECLTLSRKFRMDGLYNSALSILAQVHLRMGHCSRAVALLQTCLPFLLQQGHVWLQAEAYFTLAKCRIKQATECFSNETKRTKFLHAAVQELKKCESMFLRCQDQRRLQEVYYLLARVYNELPEARSLRDVASKRFMQASSSNPVPPTPAILMSAMISRSGIIQLSERPIQVAV